MTDLIVLSLVSVCCSVVFAVIHKITKEIFLSCENNCIAPFKVMFGTLWLIMLVFSLVAWWTTINLLLEYLK